MADVKIFTDNIEHEAVNQINTLIEQPAFSDCKVRIMPDVHAGAGCVIGFTADLGDKVIPNIVGVDIGCGMYTIKLGKCDINFDKLDSTIRAKIPSGRNVYGNLCPDYVKHRSQELIDKLNCKYELRNRDWLIHSLGTLGGGNHFIEIDEDNSGDKYLIVHSGSRNLGKQVADIYQRKAITRLYSKKDERAAIIEKLKKEGRETEIQNELSKLSFKQRTAPPKELCYLEGSDRDDYLFDMRICQRFAKCNREIIARRICIGMGWDWADNRGFHTVHNYVDSDNMVRKGAISARQGELLLIPINMRDGCILGVGKGNEDWNHSAPHGAGRIMSRIKAKEMLSIDDFKESMNGIFTTSVNEFTIDESPMAYKPMDEIISNIKDTVNIVTIIKPIYNFKACD